MKNFGMFSKEGNNLVKDMVEKAISKPLKMPKEELYNFLENEMKEIEDKGHGEIYDTAVRSKFIGEIEQKTEMDLTIYF